jgi:hypothetical protein
VDQQAWQRGPFGQVYMVLNASVEPCARAVAPGTDAAIGRTIDFLRASGNEDALRRLEAISVQVETLRQCARSRETVAHESARFELARMTEDWFAAAPMFPAGAREEGARLN